MKISKILINILVLVLSVGGSSISCTQSDDQYVPERTSDKDKDSKSSKKKKKSSKKNSSKKKSTKTKDLEKELLDEDETIEVDIKKVKAKVITDPLTLMGVFCKEVGNLELNGDFSESIDFICEDGNPLSRFKTLVDTGYEGEDGTLNIIEIAGSDVEDISHMFTVFTLKSNISAKDLMDSKMDNITYLSVDREDLLIEPTEVSDFESNGDLHLGGSIYSMNSHSVTLGTTVDVIFENEVNNYMVRDGLNNLFLTTHHMTDPPANQPKYNKFFIVMDNGEGSSYSIYFQNFSIDNGGLGEVARNKMMDAIFGHTLDTYGVLDE